MNILNKLQESKIINSIVGEEFILGEEFLQELQLEMGNRYCVADNCIDMPVNGVKKGSIPYVFSKSYKVGTDELDVEVKVTSYELERMFAFIPVNSTVEKMSPIAFRSFLVKVMAKELVEKLNKKAYEKIKSVCSASVGAYDEDDFISSLTKVAVGRPNGVILAKPEMISKILKIDDKLKLFEVPVIPVVGVEGVVIADLDYLYYVHDEGRKISVHDDFLKNMKRVYLEEYNDFAVAHPTCFKVFELS